ncbi:tetratricopeptide repeat protein [Nocardia sp. NPDC052566]|uniref:tetratricopeptide repeat protein n=1 Tax=Nocardia sp. NPDC052566 TaxID=3364330 RepID=UPI0037CC31AE
MGVVEFAIERVRIAEESGRLDEARQVLMEALVAAPGEAVLLEKLGDIAYRLGDGDEALRFAGAAIAAAPHRGDPHLTAALVYCAWGLHEDALRHARHGAALDPYDISGTLTLAKVIAEGPVTKALRGEARAALEHAVGLAPANAAAHARAAEIYWRLDEPKRARGHVEAGLAIDPANQDLLRLRVLWEFHGGKVGNRTGVIDILRGLLGSRPGHGDGRRRWPPRER